MNFRYEKAPMFWGLVGNNQCCHPSGASRRRNQSVLALAGELVDLEGRLLARAGLRRRQETSMLPFWAPAVVERFLLIPALCTGGEWNERFFMW
jgi:hypothetical protein